MSDYELIYAFENLYRAHKKARLGKQNTREVILYEMRLTENLLKLSYHLEHGSYRVKGYRKFIIYDPKLREIQALSYGDRIVQHSLCDNVLGPYLDRRLIYDNAACRINKGAHFAINRVSGFMREFYKQHGCEGYVLKCDIRKFFNSVYHPVLKKKIKEMKLDQKTKWLLGQIVDSYEHSPKRGLPMGNQTSQWFALCYLDEVDRLVKERLRIKYYSRYMDDMILIHKDKEYLKECLEKINEVVNDNLALELNEKTQIHHIRQGFDYLGFHFYLSETGKVVRKLRQSSKKRVFKKLRAYRRLYRNGRISSQDVRRSLVSIRGHMLHGHTWYLRHKIWDEFELKKKEIDVTSQNGKK